MRSGSTLQYQITARLVEEAGLGKRLDWAEPEEFPLIREQLKRDDSSWKVFKAHTCTDEMIEEFEQGNAMGVYIYRDLRDVVVSHMTKASMDLDTVFKSGFVEACLEHYQRWVQLSRLLVSQYELVVDDIAGEVNRISNHLGITLESDKIQEIANDFSIENQKARIQEFVDMKQIGRHRVDPHSLLHSNHISSGKVGRWREELNQKEVWQIEKKAGSWLAEHSYPLSEPPTALQRFYRALALNK